MVPVQKWAFCRGHLRNVVSAILAEERVSHRAGCAVGEETPRELSWAPLGHVGLWKPSPAGPCGQGLSRAAFSWLIESWFYFGVSKTFLKQMDVAHCPRKDPFCASLWSSFFLPLLSFSVSDTRPFVVRSLPKTSATLPLLSFPLACSCRKKASLVVLQEQQSHYF